MGETAISDSVCDVLVIQHSFVGYIQPRLPASVAFCAGQNNPWHCGLKYNTYYLHSLYFIYTVYL